MAALTWVVSWDFIAQIKADRLLVSPTVCSGLGGMDFSPQLT